jgi:hypothetical protein
MKDIKKLALGPNDFYHRLGPLSCPLISVAVVAVEGGREVGRWGGGEAGRRGGGEVMSMAVVVVVSDELAACGCSALSCTAMATVPRASRDVGGQATVV